MRYWTLLLLYTIDYIILHYFCYTVLFSRMILALGIESSGVADLDFETQPLVALSDQPLADEEDDLAVVGPSFALRRAKRLGIWARGMEKR